LGIFGLGIGLSGVFVALAAKKNAGLQELPVATLATLIGIFALLALMTGDGQHAAFNALVAAWGLIFGAFALYQARRWGFSDVRGRDFLISAIFALLLGALFLAVDLDVVSAVGFFGAYLALDGVHLGIAAATPKAK
jgi:peptidoglycan/LPS O-acetylase OafA/YrhL